MCFESFFCGAALWENQVKKKANLLKQTPQNKAETTIHTRKRERERERERESRRVRIGACACVCVKL